MSDYEIWGKSWYERSTSGSTGHREFTCKWESRLSVAPARGDVYPGTTDIRCVSVKFEGSGAEQPGVLDPETGAECEYTYAYIVAEYATMPAIDDELVWRYSGAQELIETGYGRLWASDGAVSEQAFAVPYPLMTVSCTKVMASNPMGWALPKIGCVNHYWWKPTINSPQFAPETLLCMNPEVEEWYDYDRSNVAGRPIYLYRCTFNFLWRPVSHNYYWRTFEGGGMWDVLLPRIYELTDFNPLVGLPQVRIPLGYTGSGGVSVANSGDGVGGSARPE